jgi:RND family efflux transporter MFP subunit
LDLADNVELDRLVTLVNSRFSRQLHSAAAALLTASAGLMLSTGCDSHPHAQVASAAASETPAAAPAAVPAPPADIAEPKSFSTTGPLVAAQQADIAAERNGRVVNIAVQIGDHVKPGQLLAQLDDRTLHSACDEQKARIASAQAAVRAWQAEESGARADLRRADALREAKIVSEEDWEHVKFKLDETIAQVARFSSEEIAAEASLNAADLQLEQSRIVAPFSGVVGSSSVRPSQQVKAGDVLFWITAEGPLRVLFTVPETSMAVFSVGKALELTTADYPGLRQAGRILRVSPVVDPASGSVQVIGEVVRPSSLLKPGMTMQVRLTP